MYIHFGSPSQLVIMVTTACSLCKSSDRGVFNEVGSSVAVSSQSFNSQERLLSAVVTKAATADWLLID